MKMKFLGSGSGLGSPKVNFQSNVAIYSDALDSYLGIDCGTTFQMAIEEAGISVMKFDAFYITHLHADHIGGMEWVGFVRYFSANPFGSNRPKLFGNTEILDNLWRHSLSGGMESLQGHRNRLSSYYDTYPIHPNGKFQWGGLDFDLVQTVHVVDNRRIKPSFGLMFVMNGKRIFYTGDTQFNPNQIWAYYRQADVIFQDCELMKYPESVHAQYHELCTLPEEFRKKMWLYHYGGATLPDDWEEKGFLGFVKKGQEFEF